MRGSGLSNLKKLNSGISGFSPNASKSNISSIAVVSGKGGVGKTTTSLNLGAALADFGRETVILDTDLATPNLLVELGYDSTSAEKTMQDILSSDIDANILSIVNRIRQNLGILPASLSQGSVQWEPENLSRFLENLDSLVLVDTPPGVGREQRKIVEAVDAVIVVITPTESSYIDGMKAAALAENTDTDILGAVINRAGSSKYDLETEEITSSIQSLKVLGTVPEDKRVKRTKHENKPVIDINENYPASIAYKELASELLGEDYTPPNTFKRIMAKVADR